MGTEINEYYFHNKWLNFPVFAKTDSTIYIYQNSSIDFPDTTKYKSKFYNNFLFLDYHKNLFEKLGINFKNDCMISPEGDIREYEGSLDLIPFYICQEGDEEFIEKVYFDKNIKVVDFRERKIYYDLHENMVDLLNNYQISEYINILGSCKEKYYYNKVFAKTSDLIFKYNKKKEGFTPGNLFIVKNLPKNPIPGFTYTSIDNSGIYYIDFCNNSVIEKDLKLNLEPFDASLNLEFYNEIIENYYHLSFIDFTNNTYSNTLKNNLVKSLSQEELDSYINQYNTPLNLSKSSRWYFLKKLKIWIN